MTFQPTSTGQSAPERAIEMHQIEKWYGAFQVLHGVDLSVVRVFGTEGVLN